MKLIALICFFLFAASLQDHSPSFPSTDQLSCQIGTVDPSEEISELPRSRSEFLDGLRNFKEMWRSDLPIYSNESGSLISKRAVIYAAQSIGFISVYADGLTVFSTAIATMNDSSLWSQSDLAEHGKNHKHLCSLEFVMEIIDLFERWQDLVWNQEALGWGMCPTYEISLVNSCMLDPIINWLDHHPPKDSNSMVKTRRLTVSQIHRSFQSLPWRQTKLINSHCFSIPMTFSEFIELVISMKNKQRK